MSKAMFFGSVFFAFFVLINLGYASSIGVSPKKIEFFDYDKEKQITLYNPNENNISFVIKAENGSLIRFPAKGEIDGKSATKVFVTKNNSGQYSDKAEDRLVVSFFEDKKSTLDIITSASIQVVIHKNTTDLINLNEAQQTNENGIGNSSGWLNASSILTMIAVLIIVGVFVWIMVFN